MSEVRRLFSRRDKKHPQPKSPSEIKDRSRAKRHASPFGTVFTLDDDSKAKADKEDERAITGILERLRRHGIHTFTEANARYALHTTKGDLEESFRLLMLLQETYEGLVKPFDPRRKLLGAVNREGVTCFLDALLFAMFMRLDSFEAMLYDTLDDPNKKRLAGLLRLWVNMLRSGRLITPDITRNLQEALAECGWLEARKLCQQDASEAFTFITDQLQLPLMTLKMDLYHTGKDDPTDDHKFVNERLLEVAILDKPVEGKTAITLEDCLESYFNNRIEVKRFLEHHRRNTLKSVEAGAAYASPSVVKEKDQSSHVEVVEVAGTPAAQTSISEESKAVLKGPEPLKKRPGIGRARQDSIFSQRKVELIGVDPEQTGSTASGSYRSERKMSTRTEVMMPAWQFFKLLPWYTDHMPTTDAQVAAHFARKRPVLGICLKRYSYSNSGQATRLATYIDIPLEIDVPSFISDDQLEDEIDNGAGPVGGRFRLVLQSVVCHRGTSVHSGHYVTLCRGARTPEEREQHRVQQESVVSDASSGSDDLEDMPDPWVRFDDLAQKRVTYIDIFDALKQETPYLLFYQVQPIDDDGRSVHDLPSYAEAISRSQSDAGRFSDMDKSDGPYLQNEAPGSDNALVITGSSPGSISGVAEAHDHVPRPPSSRPSLEVPRSTFRSGSHARAPSKGPRSSLDSNSRPATTPPGPITPVDERIGSSAGSVGSAASNAGSSTFLGLTNRLGMRNSQDRRNDVRKDTTASSGIISDESAANMDVPSSLQPSQTDKPERESRFSLNMSKLTQRISRATSRHADGRSDSHSRRASVSISSRPSSNNLLALSAGESTGPGPEGDYFRKAPLATPSGSNVQSPSQPDSSVASPRLAPIAAVHESGESPSVSEDSTDTPRPSALSDPATVRCEGVTAEEAAGVDTTDFSTAAAARKAHTVAGPIGSAPPAAALNGQAGHRTLHKGKGRDRRERRAGGGSQEDRECVVM